ncbi:hypothetical protein SAMN04515668_0359 [Hymenobacter arizonensis]|uniref:Uncharacterized protein n=2 Tax=Hymenobacter arizonensis TaxID=1227077 RepID=A0A1I5T8F8_HYMAR|nr:hypothetical protein SAMN04515668_0359 [Hymenobacter arizonensis]
MDDARNQLADATKKLKELDAQLEGLGQDSDAGKKIVAQMAAAAKQVQSLTAEIDGLSESLDDIKPGTVPALRAEVEALEKAFNLTVIGTKEYDAALLALGRRKGDLKSLEDSLDALAPKERAAAFVDMANGLAGVVGVSVAAGEALGLSANSAAEYEKKMQTVVAVTSAFEAISKAVNSESRANIKNLLATARAYLTGGEAATSSGKAARLAIAGTGIGLLIIALAFVVTNWEKLTKTVVGSEAGFARVKATASGLFDGLIASVKAGAEALTKFVTGDFSGAAATMRGAGKKIGDAYNAGFQESMFEGYKVQLALQVEHNARLIEIAKAKGKDTFAAEEKQLKDRYVLLDRNNKDELKQSEDVLKELVLLRVNHRKKLYDAEVAATQARLDGVAAIEAAKGEDAFRELLKAKKNQLKVLQAAAQPDQAAIIAKQDEISALTIQYEQQVAEKRRAALVLAQQEEVALLEKQGKDSLDLRLKFAEQLLAGDRDGTEKQRAQREADYQALLLLQIEYNNREQAIRDANRAQQQGLDEADADIKNRFMAAAGEKAIDLYTEGLGKGAKKGADLGRSILIGLFGVKPEDVEAVKASLNAAFADIAQSVSGAVSAMLTEGLNAADAKIQEAQTRLGELDSQLSAVTSKRQADEQALAESSGAKRDFLLGKLEKERAEEQRLTSEKAKAAKQEQAAAKEKARLQKEQNQLSAASTAVEALLLGIKAAQTLVDIASKGKFGIDNIALAVAAAATLGTGIFAMKSAAATFQDGTGALGSNGVLRGPSHQGGGIALFSRYGHFYGEAEGGEAITPTDATLRNAGALELIRTAGRTRTLTPNDFAASFQNLPYHVIPPPAGYYPGHYASGGTLPSVGGLASGGGASAVSVDALRADVQQTNALLQQMLRHTASTADSNKAIAEKPPIVPDHETALRYRYLASEVDDAQAMAEL